MQITDLNDLKIALVHDFLTANGGAEKVLWALHEIFPAAPIYTLRYDEQKTHGQFSECNVIVAKLGQSFLGKRPMLALPFLPNAVETLPLSPYDLIISSSSAFSKGIITKPSTLHICYCHTPMRYVWDWTHEYAQENGYEKGVKSLFYRLITHYLRIWDQASAQRPDRWIANSRNVSRRIEKYYHKKADVIYPPVAVIHNEIDGSENPTDEPYFLIVSRLSPYKKIDLAVTACARLKQPLVVIGEGRERDRLKALANQLSAPVAFLGYQNDKVIQQYYAHARAFIFAGEDDFGITPVEAMSYGKPVIAYGKGGVLETVINEKTGLFFNEPTVESLTDTLEIFIKIEDKFDRDLIILQAEKFSDKVFKEKIIEYTVGQWQKFSRTK